MTEEILQLVGERDGPTSIILAGVHGDEKYGVEALKKTLSTLKIDAGRVFWGYGNPMALEAHQRFINADLNRMFKSEEELSDDIKKGYEYKRAQFLKAYFKQADALLDIHTSRTPNSKPFAICEDNAREIVSRLPVELVVSGFDKVEPGGTDYYMNSIGKIGICIECGFGDDPVSAQVAEENIQAFLKALGHIKNDLNPREQSMMRVYELYLTKTNNFVLSKQFEDFEEVLEGQLIGMDGDKEVLAQGKAVILFARNRERVGAEAFLLGKIESSLY